MSWVTSYRVRYWNPEMPPGNGFIDGFRLARDAKMSVEKFNALYDRDGRGIRAEYLGKKSPHKKDSAA